MNQPFISEGLIQKSCFLGENDKIRLIMYFIVMLGVLLSLVKSTVAHATVSLTRLRVWISL